MSTTRLALTGVLLMALIVGCEPAQRPSQDLDAMLEGFVRDNASAEAPRRATDAPVTRTGTHTANTAPFELSGGDYHIVSTATDGATSRVGCFHATNLVSADGAIREGGGDVEPGGGQTASAESYVYGLPAGRYYFDIISGCGDWTVTITPA
jgi:hypothetical protein